MTLDGAKSAVFDTETYKILFLEYLRANNLPFAHANSPALAVLLAYARRCDTVDLPTINRQSMKAALDIVYRELADKLKSKFAKHASRNLRVGESRSVNIVNSQDGDDGRKRKRSDAQVKQRSSSTGGAECADTSYLQNAKVLSEMEDLGVSRTQNSEDTSEAEFLDTTHEYPEFGDSDVSDAETLASRQNLESGDAELSDA